MKELEKIDLYKLHKEDYATPKKPILVQIKPTSYLTIEGKGAPGGTAFTTRIGALYGMAYTIKMTKKFARLHDYTVCKLEGIWWSESRACFTQLPKDEWQWKLLIRTPAFIAPEDLEQAVTVLLKRGKEPEVRLVKLELMDEGRCVQMLHVGPYDQEGKTIEQMEKFAASQDLELAGRHHEIYLSDPRRVASEKLKTILRHPVRDKT